ncbi:hypothetical protein BpHYR1_040158 [Brachionus plicatilis]|uniref:BED-type domain-containing protein n=1 Tax=Brachionus plicatilis TaxID=10195 RepID=A0A3M7SJP5_BRAPC|nr:hypothetical protein BpHYR1_040158 [Brachionus plicatilis]
MSSNQINHPNKKNTKRSWVWGHFQNKLNDASKTICKHCNAQLSFHSNTNGMITHLNSVHKLYKHDKFNNFPSGCLSQTDSEYEDDGEVETVAI